MEKEIMPVLFVGHGSPMNAIEDNEFSRGWKQIAAELPRPKAVLCISAHWETTGTQATAMPRPRTIHDFGGFPRALFDKQYPAAGSPELAERVRGLVKAAAVSSDHQWGLDHGTWSVLAQMYPQADIPVVQLSLDREHDTTQCYQLGVELQPLREEGVLILGSGNCVHNLRTVVWDDVAFDWALDFDLKVKKYIQEDNPEPLVHYEKLGRSALLSVNSAEHYLPLLFILGARQKGDALQFYNEKVWGGSLSMRCVRFG